MNHINNENNVNLRFTKRSQRQKTNKTAEATNKREDADVNSTNLKQNYSEIIGRSQVKFGINKLSIKEDLDVFVNNPERVEDTNKFFDLAYNRYLGNKENPYEYASVLAETYYDMRYKK